MPSIVIAPRFCGPPQSGNGGYVCGRLAAFIPGSASVRLKAPPPLDRPLTIDQLPTMVRLLDGSNTIAEGWPTTLTLQPPKMPTLVEARGATKAYAGFSRHAFPNCFVCGPLRPEGDGLRIFPGRIGSGEMVAAPWVPDISLKGGTGHVSPEFLWAALDCTSAYAFPPPAQGKAVVLGELAVRIDSALTPGDSCVCAAWPLTTNGRKRFSGSAIFSNGSLVAVGAATWIEVDASLFGGT